MTRIRIVVVGAGFGGLAAARALRRTPAEIILIDRTNHHVFQPLLYQVATSVLAPSQIGSPIRGILRKQKNVTVILGEVTGVDKDKKCTVRPLHFITLTREAWRSWAKASPSCKAERSSRAVLYPGSHGQLCTCSFWPRRASV